MESNAPEGAPTPREAADRVEVAADELMKQAGQWHGHAFADEINELVFASRALAATARATAPAGPVEGGDLAALRHVVWTHLAAVFSAAPGDRGERLFYSTDVGGTLTSDELAERIARDVLAATPRPATGEAGGRDEECCGHNQREHIWPDGECMFCDCPGPAPTPSTADAPQGEGDRCASCEHRRTHHASTGECWYSVTAPRPDAVLGCACREFIPESTS